MSIRKCRRTSRQCIAKWADRESAQPVSIRNDCGLGLPTENGRTVKTPSRRRDPGARVPTVNESFELRHVSRSTLQQRVATQKVPRSTTAACLGARRTRRSLQDVVAAAASSEDVGGDGGAVGETRSLGFSRTSGNDDSGSEIHLRRIWPSTSGEFLRISRGRTRSTGLESTVGPILGPGSKKRIPKAAPARFGQALLNRPPDQPSGSDGDRGRQ